MEHTLNSIKSSTLITGIEISDLLADDESQLNLIVKTDAPGLNNWTGTGEEDGGRRLEEEEWLFWPLIVQLCDMVSMNEPSIICSC